VSLKRDTKSMPTYVDSLRKDFTLSPTERKQREEIMEAMETVQAAITLLQNQTDLVNQDLKTRKIISASVLHMAKIHAYVANSLSLSSSPQV
jgi:hypothetical protein